MNLSGVVLLFGFTARSRTYAQALVRAGLKPEKLILFGDAGRDVPMAVERSGKSPVALPDLSETLCTTAERAGWSSEHSTSADINDPSVVAAVRRAKPRLVMVSSYSAQLVRTPLFDLNIPMLHVHAGWLPDFRGSTTLYYSWLARGDCGATAFLLTPGIDEGPILAKRAYPPPPPGVDVDYLYDNAIRADLLVKVLRRYATNGELPISTPQPEENRETYFVIHPVLKHIALLSREDCAKPTSARPS